jgi:hypothetical protein
MRKGFGHFDVVLQVHEATVSHHIENSPQRQLLDVVTWAAATHDDRITLHINLAKMHPAARVLSDVTDDGLLHGIHQKWIQGWSGPPRSGSFFLSGNLFHGTRSF